MKSFREEAVFFWQEVNFGQVEIFQEIFRQEVPTVNSCIGSSIDNSSVSGEFIRDKRTTTDIPSGGSKVVNDRDGTIRQGIL